MSDQPSISTIQTMADVWDAYRSELQGVEEQIQKNLNSPVALVNTVAGHILSSGGKRVRPLLLLLCARLCGYTGTDHHLLGCLVEYIHTATLLHDDVVDDADLRRGRRTARRVWGNQISILVGDYLYSKAMRQIVDFRSHIVNEVLADACWKMAEGEVLQLYYNGNPSMPEADYLRIVEHKTAGLIAASCHMGAIIADASRPSRRPCSGSANIWVLPFRWRTTRWTTRQTATAWARRSGRTCVKARPRCRYCTCWGSAPNPTRT